MPDNIVQFSLPRKPRVVEKAGEPDQRKVSIVPIRAIGDKKLGDATFRALAMVCSFCNRAGITWVSQKRLATDMKVSQQGISKHIRKLQEAGYIEVVRKGFRGERATTLRVIFDPTVDTDTAIAITSAQEDTRPPHLKEQQMQDMTPDIEGQRRVAQLIAKALKSTTNQKERTMPAEGDTLTVKKMKAEIKKKAPKRVTSTTSEVVHEGASHSQPKEPPFTTSLTTSEVVQNSENTVIRDICKEYLNEELLVQLTEVGMTHDDIAENLPHLLDAYKAEGLTPTGKQLVESLTAMHRSTH